MAPQLRMALAWYVAQQRGGMLSHPWPQPLPSAWSGNWGTATLVYVAVQPTVVVGAR